MEVKEYRWNSYYNTNVIQWDNSRTKQFRLDSFDLMRWNRNHLVWVGLPLRQIRQFQGHLYANTRRTFPHGNDVNEDDDCHYGDLFHPNFYRLAWISSKGKTVFSLNFLFFTPEFEWNLETEGEIKYLDEGKICSYAKYYI